MNDTDVKVFEGVTVTGFLIESANIRGTRCWAVRFTGGDGTVLLWLSDGTHEPSWFESLRRDLLAAESRAVLAQSQAAAAAKGGGK